MENAAKDLCAMGAKAVLIKGGHFVEAECPDVLYLSGANTSHWFTVPRIETQNTHGTGCTLSSAITAYLGRGYALIDAVQKAKDFLTEAIQVGRIYTLGHGHGPVHHFCRYW